MLAEAHGTDHPSISPADMRQGGMSHADMPCCDDTADISGDSQAADLCQLTCASGGCAVAVPAHSLMLQAAVNTLPYPLHSSALLSPSPQNLLRPPIGA